LSSERATDIGLLQPSDIALRERVKELTCLYGIARLMGRLELSTEEIMQAAELLPRGWLYPDSAVAHIELDGRSFSSKAEASPCCNMRADLRVNGQKRGVVEVGYDHCQAEKGGPFLAEERHLIDAIARELGLLLERREAAAEKARLREQLRRADRLATLGQLSAGVAHELNEPLGAILGFAQLALDAPELADQVRQDLDRIVTAALHARETVRKMMVFAHQAPPKKKNVDLNALVTEGLDLLVARCQRLGVELVTELDEDLPRLEADPGQLYQVIVNLAVNAVQAMPRGGRLAVSTRRARAGVALVVEDQGVGIPADRLEKVFDPFFTTKDVGEGTGLGLAVVQGIVTSHGGTIEVTSEDGRGARFTVQLPASGDPDRADDTRPRTTVLAVDDSPEILEVVRRNLSRAAYEVRTTDSVAGAMEMLEASHVDLVITDLKMPVSSGIDLVRHVRENLKDTAVMMITGYATIESAVDAVKAGAEEYLPKPFTALELQTAVTRVMERLRERRAASRGQASTAEGMDHGIIGDSHAIRTVLGGIARASTTPATVLISGESGTGKELVARAIHYSSPRAARPFIPINCGAIPGELFESELFGHVRGAFTGATSTTPGFFQAADGGTIFLDEVSEMSSSVQVKLLRIIQDGEVWMVGSTQPRKVDVRILAATNKDPAILVKKRWLREDLYFRLSVINLPVPPLRERDNDVLLLARHFAARFAAEADRPEPGISDSACRALKSYSWPGNVRELQNIMNHLVVMTDGKSIDVSDLPSLMRFSPDPDGAPARTLAEVENDYIRSVLASVDGNKTRAARLLGIDRKTLRERLKKTIASS